MMTIGDSQMTAFQAAIDRRFTGMATDYLFDTYPRFFGAMPRDEVAGFVARTIAKGKTYGITDFADLADFITATAQLGADFEDEPAFSWAVDILNNKTVPAQFRVTRLLAAIIDHFENEGEA